MDEASEASDIEPNSKAIVPDEMGSDLDSGSEDDSETKIYEENDIPHPKDHADLVHWLQLSDAHIDDLHTSAAPAHCGPYHNNKVGKEISTQRAQDLPRRSRRRGGEQR